MRPRGKSMERRRLQNNSNNNNNNNNNSNASEIPVKYPVKTRFWTTMKRNGRAWPDRPPLGDRPVSASASASPLKVTPQSTTAAKKKKRKKKTKKNDDFTRVNSRRFITAFSPCPPIPWTEKKLGKIRKKRGKLSRLSFFFWTSMATADHTAIESPGPAKLTADGARAVCVCVSVCVSVC